MSYAISFHHIEERAQNWLFNRLAVADGAQLRVAQWQQNSAQIRNKPQGTVLLIQGLGECIEKYTPIAEEFSSLGYQVYSFDLRGQGESSRTLLNNPDICHIDDFKTYVDDLSLYCTQVWAPQTDAHLPRFIIAHSTGAHIALRYLAEQKDNIPTLAGLVVSSPFFMPRLPVPVKAAEAIMEMAAKRMPHAYAAGERPFAKAQKLFITNKCTQDEAIFNGWKALQESAPQRAKGGISWGWGRAALRSRHFLLADLSTIETPTLALINSKDPRISGREQFQMAQLPNCQITDFPDAYHELFFEKPAIRERVWQSLLPFLRHPQP